MGDRTYEEKMANIKLYETTELFVEEWLNENEGPGHQKIYGPEQKWDIIGPKNYEVKTYKVGSQPCVTKECYTFCKADYIIFVEVTDEVKPTGKIIVVKWKDLRQRVTGDRRKNKWVQIAGRRFCWFIKEKDLLELPWAVRVDNKKEKIDDLLSQKSLDYLSSN